MKAADMLLAIDVGNTNTVYAVFDATGTIVGEWRSSTDVNRTADEIGVWLAQLMTFAEIDRRAITAVIVSSVVPSTVFNLRVLSRRYFSCQAMVIGAPEVSVGIGILVDRPEEVGADRLVNAVAAHMQYGGPLVVIDFGTATTFDVVDGEGNYLGGAITPGINLSLSALHAASAQLPRVAIGRPERVIGRTTVQAMRSGIFWGYVGLSEGMVRRIEQEYGAPMKVVTTGGLAPLFSECSPLLQTCDPALTLKGLLEVYRRNAGR